MDTARAIATRFFGAAPDTVEAIEGMGSVNRMFIVRWGEQAIIVRLPKEEDQWRAEAFYEKERWCIEAAQTRAHIPSPEVLDLGIYEGWPYQIQRFITGVNGEHSGLDATQFNRLLGEYARRFHAISLTGFGETLPDFLAADGRARWHRFITYNLESLTADDPLLALEVYQSNQRKAIVERFETLYALNAPLGLTHGDLSPRNTIFTPDQTLVLIDWGCAEAHLVPHYDLYYLPSEFREDFMDGYGWNTEYRAELYTEVENLALLKAFDLVRWAIDRCPARITELADAARLIAQTVA